MAQLERSSRAEPSRPGFECSTKWGTTSFPRRVRSGPGLRPDPDPAGARDRCPGAPVADVLEPPQEIGAAAGAGRFVAVADQPGVVGLLHGHGDTFAALRATAELGALPGHDEAPWGGDRSRTNP